MIALKVLILLALLLLVTASPAFADHDDHQHFCDEFATGEVFGLHVAEHAHLGHLGAEMNPGLHHQGYSECVP